MTKAEIISKGTYLNYESENFSEFEIKILIPFFKKDVSIKVFGLTSLDNNLETDLLVQRINEILSFSKENIKWLKAQIWKHYEISVANTNYGMVDYNNFENEIEANKAYFCIFNEDDAFQKINISQIHFDISFKEDNYFNIEYNCPWEDEHGIIITVKDGHFDSIT